MPWEFIRFGLSTSDETNYGSMSPDGETLYLNSCLADESGVVVEKGGKLMPYFDGISYFYRTIHAATPFFSLQADFTVDFLNPNPDGQEGFGIILRDRLGRAGDSANNYLANSCSVLAKGFLDDDQKTLRDYLGYRFVWDLTNEEASLNNKGSGQSLAKPFAPTLAKVKEGETYRLRLVKDEAGFHVAYLGYGSVREAHFPEPLRMLREDQDVWYIGMAAARGCNVSVRNIVFETSEDGRNSVRYPMPREAAKIELLNRNFPAGILHRLPIFSRTDGRIEIRSSTATSVMSVKAREISWSEPILLPLGKSDLVCSFSSDNENLTKTFPIETQALPGDLEEVRSDVMPDATILKVSPSDPSEGNATEAIDLLTAITYTKPGTRIELAPGIYKVSTPLTIAYGNSGSPVLPNELVCPGGEAVIDFVGTGGPFLLNGDYWHLQGLRIRNSGPDCQGLKIGGSHNEVRNVILESNGNTGLQISAREDFAPSSWPHDNHISFCVSCDNADPGLNNADGFAAKSACGDNNTFLGCLSYNNIDDGFDLYTRISNGPIGLVTIDRCVCVHNGHNFAGTMRADGNGFKLGGEGIPAAHVLRGSLAYENDADGITSNSNPAVQAYHCLSAAQKERNYAIYGQGVEAAEAVLEDCTGFGGELPDLLPPGSVISRGPARELPDLLDEWLTRLLEEFPEEENKLRLAITALLQRSR